MLKITNIDTIKLTQAGYEATEHGYRKKFPSIRFRYYLYLQENDIYGTITGKMGSDEVLDYEPWLQKLEFRSHESAESVRQEIIALRISGVITAADEA